MKRLLRITRWILTALAVVFFVIGGIGWFTGFHTPPWEDASYEMPLGDLDGIAVDSKGNLYCASQFYSRVQKYDSNGRFLLGWPIDCAGGIFRIRMTRNDELEVVTARKDMYYRFSPQGELLEAWHTDGKLFHHFGPSSSSECSGADGTVYQVHYQWLSPSVVKVDPSGKRTTVVSTPFRKWIIMGPYPAWLFLMAGVLILMVLNKDKVFRKSEYRWYPAPLARLMKALFKKNDGREPCSDDHVGEDRA